MLWRTWGAFASPDLCASGKGLDGCPSCKRRYVEEKEERTDMGEWKIVLQKKELANGACLVNHNQSNVRHPVSLENLLTLSWRLTAVVVLGLASGILGAGRWGLSIAASCT